MASQYTQAKITLTGLAGTGKSSAGKILKDALNLKCHLSAGDFVREMVEGGKWGLQTLDEFETRAQTDFRYDCEIDQRTTNFGVENTSFVFDGRMAWDCIPRSIKILLTCDDTVRFERVANHRNMSVNEAVAQTIHREASIRFRFHKWYRFARFDDPKHFDLVIDTTDKPSELVVGDIIDFAASRGVVRIAA